MVEFFSQLVQLVQSRSGLRRSNVQYKVGLCMIRHREVMAYIAQLFAAEGFNYVSKSRLASHVCMCHIPLLLWTLFFLRNSSFWLVCGFFFSMIKFQSEVVESHVDPELNSAFC